VESHRSDDDEVVVVEVDLPAAMAVARVTATSLKTIMNCALPMDLQFVVDGAGV
jgi:hypothetical protein